MSTAWCTHARRELCSRLCRYEGASITDVDVECLNDAGRPWEVVIAGRQLPQLARLRGFGFVVDVQAVREADLSARPNEYDAPLGGETLLSCIQGEGDPPDELLLAAVACAASGEVRYSRPRPASNLVSVRWISHFPLACSLRQNELGTKGAVELMKGLKSNSTLRSL